MELEFCNIVDKRILANFLGIEYKELTYILYAKKTDNLYQSFEIPKKNGGLRCINAPMEPLKRVQRNLAKRLLIVQEKHYINNNAIVHGFTRKRSIISNGRRHRNKCYVLNLDLEDFFDSFHFGRVKGYFQKNKYFQLSEDVSACLANIACYKGKLPQGSPSSPVITNLICSILDRRIALIAKKYHLDYTRYADDLTFSTNDKKFLENVESLLSELYSEIEKSGFKVNQSKTRISFCDSRQEVTGLVVNEKISVKREFYKQTRSMLDYMYKGLPIKCNDVEISQQQLEGRLAFINQIDKYNNNDRKNHKTIHNGMNAREKQYQKFLFYKHFYQPDKPVIVTEGKTDIVYIRSALQKYYLNYPQLINKKEDGSFEYKVSFLNRTCRSNPEKITKLEFFLGIQKDGASAMKNIYNFYTGKNGYPNLVAFFSEKYKITPINPVILLFDNENDTATKSKRPLQEFLNYIGRREALGSNLGFHIQDNLYLVTIPLVKGKPECEIEDLFPDEVLNHEIDGKKFDRKGKDSEKSYGKHVFSLYIAKNLNDIDFEGFIPLIETISKIVSEYKVTRT